MSALHNESRSRKGPARTFLSSPAPCADHAGSSPVPRLRRGEPTTSGLTTGKGSSQGIPFPAPPPIARIRVSAAVQPEIWTDASDINRTTQQILHVLLRAIQRFFMGHSPFWFPARSAHTSYCPARRQPAKDRGEYQPPTSCLFQVFVQEREDLVEIRGHAEGGIISGNVDEPPQTAILFGLMT